MINVRGLDLTLNKNHILDDINVHFEKGKISGLVGRNGSGKTMLMKCICGFIRPDKGEVRVDGKHIGKDCDFPESLGLIIETPGFIPAYSGYKNLKILAGINSKIGRDEIREAMRKVGLDPDMKKSVRKYSLGMRQRLGIAQAIMENPKLLVLDEPFNGLDVEGLEEMRTFFLEYKKNGGTILMASHSKEDIGILCDMVYTMEHGRITSRSL
ncbi:MAG: ABC transporter ATP-binding protein [Lachnospiraceae bacterium]|nr:ABC transporter ATP-binding protein [Lachnospiraceae bacterium]